MHVPTSQMHGPYCLEELKFNTKTFPKFKFLCKIIAFKTIFLLFLCSLMNILTSNGKVSVVSVS